MISRSLRYPRDTSVLLQRHEHTRRDEDKRDASRFAQAQGTWTFCGLFHQWDFINGTQSVICVYSIRRISARLDRSIARSPTRITGYSSSGRFIRFIRAYRVPRSIRDVKRKPFCADLKSDLSARRFIDYLGSRLSRPVVAKAR